MGPLSLGNPAIAALLQIHRPDDVTLLEEAEPEQPTQDAVYTRTLAIERGDTLMPKLVKAGIAPDDAHAAINALGEIYDPRRIRPGQALTVTFREPAGLAAADATFEGFTLELDRVKQVAVARRDDGGFSASAIEAELRRDLAGATGIIDSSLYDAAVSAGVPVPVLVEMIRAFSWDVDFQRDIQPGDGFEVLYERFRDADGKAAQYGKVMFATMTLSGERKAIYRYASRDGQEDFYDANGQSVRKALLRTPMDGARLSSGFGKRRHPILGYTRMHKGIDFAAPSGSPIFAAGDGTVEVAATNNGYGRYVRIRHNAEFATAYAHLKGYGKGVTKGARVRQGQIIGYVGMSGLATGPHLHYEVMRQGGQVNPLSVRMPVGRKLDGADLKRFAVLRAELERQWAAADLGDQVAEGSRP